MEQVLVVSRSVFEQVGVFQGLSHKIEPYLREFFDCKKVEFRPRDPMEGDATFKQIIPYVVLTYGDRYLCYLRGKRVGEQRLVGRRSIGIGGHINPTDDDPLFNRDYAVMSRAGYLTAVRREVHEEVRINCDHSNDAIALVNDDSTEVGRVHIGIIHRWKLCDPGTVEKKERPIAELQWLTLPELWCIRDELESWSRFYVDAMTRHEVVQSSSEHTLPN